MVVPLFAGKGTQRRRTAPFLMPRKVKQNNRTLPILRGGSMYYDPYYTLSHNALFNFIIGNRGGGKTFGGKTWCINDFIKNNQQFVYLRRYTKELKTLKTFWQDIAQHHPEHDFEVKGKTFIINGKIAGYAMALSTSKIEKSTTFPNVNKIIFDEFIIDKGVYHYLPNEIEYFLEFYETIARTRDVKVMFLANAITQTNPYFLYFNIELPYNKNVQTFFNDGAGRFTKKRNKTNPDILIELVADHDFIEMKSKTRFGQLVAGTNYFSYAVENEFLRDSKEFIDKKGKGANHRFTIVYKDKQIGVWVDFIKGLYYLSEDVDPYNKLLFVFTTPEHTTNTLLISSIKKSALLSPFFENFKLGNVRFESVDIKNVFYELVKTVNI